MGRICEKDVRIRKPRNCFGCLRRLKAGDRGHIQTNTEEGKIYSITLCADCKTKIGEMHCDDEFYEGELKDSPHD